MNRRNVLIGLGGVVAGGGALLGTGAFTTVEAERTVSVETTDDASAFLGLSAARGDLEGSNFVTEENGTIQINLDGDSPGEGDGLNQNARSRFENLVAVSNNGTQNVESLEFTLDVETQSDDTAHADAFKIVSGETTIDADGEDLLAESDEGDASNDTLEPGQEMSFGVEIDLLIEDGIDDIEDGAEFTLTIEAQTDN